MVFKLVPMDPFHESCQFKFPCHLALIKSIIYSTLLGQNAIFWQPPLLYQNFSVFISKREPMI